MSETANTKATAGYSRKDFQSDQTVRWCPGCGDYSILAQMQRVMPEICAELAIPRENIVFVSGIGCSSRFPYYMDTYGFHTIHGRAPTIATGLAVSRPDLQVWVVTGDGDGLSIGGNHLIHCLRRNVDIKILLFNNEIYGLTKGQYSPTSQQGKRTKSSPMGSVEEPMKPLYTAIAAGATFAARAIATDSGHLQEVLKRAARHRGSAFVEIFQNCNVFNDGTFDHFTAREVKDERTLYLEHGQPLHFGRNGEHTLCFDSARGGITPVVKTVDGACEADVVVHDEKASPNYLARFLAQMDEHTLPMPLGVYQAIDKPTYGEMLDEQVVTAMTERGRGALVDYLHQGDTWEVN